MGVLRRAFCDALVMPVMMMPPTGFAPCFRSWLLHCVQMALDDQATRMGHWIIEHLCGLLNAAASARSQLDAARAVLHQNILTSNGIVTII
jgi:hypothetical protein